MHRIQTYFSYLLSSHHSTTYLSAQPDLYSTPLWYSLLICCHPLSTTYATSSLKITNRSFRYTSLHLWNQLVSFRQRINHSADLSSHFLTFSNPPAHHLHPPSHIHYFIPGSKLTFSTNLFHHSLLAPTELSS